MDHRFGRFMNHNLAEYHVPVNADVHDIDVIFVEEHDDKANPLGVKGWARSASSAPPPRSPTPSSTRPAGASASCRSPSTRSWPEQGVQRQEEQAISTIV